MRCSWSEGNQLIKEYHDQEYGVYKTDTNELFMWLILEMAQAGLSWQTIINRRLDYIDYYQGFDVNNVANFDFDDLILNLEDAKIIRNKLKLKASIEAAKIIIEIEKEQSFINYLKNLIDETKTLDDNVNNAVKILKKRGFKFIGYEIIKSFFESVGLINNHDLNCDFYIKPIYTLKVL